MLIGRVLPLLAVLAFSGCASTTKPNIAIESLAGFRLVDAEVSFVSDATVDMADVPETNQGQQAAEIIKTVFRREVGAKLQGNRPVKARIAVKVIKVPSDAAVMLAGSLSAMEAGVDLVDAKSGEILVSRPRLVKFSSSGGGVAASGIAGGIAAGIVSGVIAGAQADKERQLQFGRAEKLVIAFSAAYTDWLFSS